MSNWTECVIDASMSNPATDGGFCFCPIEGDIHDEFSVVTDLNVFGSRPPQRWRLVAIIHPDGDEAVARWCEENAAELDALTTAQTDAAPPTEERA